MSARARRVLRADESDFDREVLGRSGRVAALFFAEWCPYARRFLKVFEQAELPATEKAVVDVSDEGGLWDRYRVRVVPTVVVFSDGREVRRLDGVPAFGLTERDLDRLRADAC